LNEPGRIRVADRWISEERLVVGGLSRALVLDHPAQVDVAGIQLAPGCACLLRDQPATLRNVVATVRELAPELDRALARWADSTRNGPVDLHALASVVANHVDPHCDRLMAFAGASLVRADSSVEQLAAACHLSRRQFSRRFRCTFGVTAREFIQLARFARACRMASTGGAPSWSGLAATVGYADQSHLIRDFQQLVGLSPTRVFSHDWYANVAPTDKSSPMAHPSKTR
jgi:AraC-like DNA-binding protein